MIKFLLKNFLVLSFLALTSCSLFKKTDSSKRIRIVDLQGKSHAVKTRVPALNARMIDSQNRMRQGIEVGNGDILSHKGSDASPDLVKNNQPVAGNKYATADYEAASSELSKQRMQSPNASKNQKAKLINDQPSKLVAGKVVSEKEAEIEYDLSGETVDVKIDVKEERKPSKKASVLAKYKPSSLKKASIKSRGKSRKVYKGVFIQAGAFSNRNNAKRSAAIMKKFAKVRIEESRSGNKKVYRVLLGSFPNKSTANKTIRKVKKAGYDAIIVRKR